MYEYKSYSMSYVYVCMYECKSYVICHVSWTLHPVSCNTYHMSYVIRHMSYIMPHISHIIVCVRVCVCACVRVCSKHTRITHTHLPNFAHPPQPHMSYAMYHGPYIPYHASRIICHMLYVISHTFQTLHTRRSLLSARKHKILHRIAPPILRYQGRVHQDTRHILRRVQD